MWRYYLIDNKEVLFRTDSRQEAVERMDALVWERGTGANPVVLVRSAYRKQLDVVKRDDV